MADDEEATAVSRKRAGVGADDVDEATVVTRKRTDVDQATVVMRKRSEVDDATVVARKPADDADKTVASRRKKADFDDTVVVAGSVDDRTAISDTVASLTQRPDRTRKVRRAPRIAPTPPPGAPGILADGRVASRPGRHVERYPVRVAEPPPSVLVRHTQLAPIVEARRNLDPAAIAQDTAQARVNQALGTVIAMVIVTTVAAAGVVAAIVILSQR